MKLSSRNTLALVLCAPFLLVSMQAQQPWQRLQAPTAAAVAKAWVTPPSEYGPEPYYGLNGPVTLESVQHDLDTMKSLGFRAVTVQAGGGMVQPFMSAEYLAFFKQFVLEAKKRDMRVWIVDDIGYPSGFAGGAFSKEKPELRMQALSIEKRLPVHGGETLMQAVDENSVSAVAMNAAGERIAVPISANAIHWTAPAGGDWTVLVVAHVFRTSPTKSDTNPTHQKDQSQSLEDYLNPEATQAYLQFIHQKYYDAMPEEFGKTIMGFRGDEPDYSISGLPWTPAFFERFQQLKGYDVRPYLGALIAAQPSKTQAGVALTEQELRAKGDYYDVFSQMFRDGFFKPQGDWCAAHQVEYQVHLNHEEMEMNLVRSEGDFLRDMKYVQVPGIDSIWHQIWMDTVSDFPRLAASAAHVYGHPRAFTESFAAYRPEPDLPMARYILNEQFVRGVNLIETMYYPATQPASAEATGQRRRGGPSQVMRDPGWPALMQYVQRMSYVMSMGRPTAEVALYIPSSSMWLGDAASDTAFVATEQMLSERQIDFDIINGDALAGELKLSPSGFTTLSGNTFRTVIVPSASVLSETELTRLKTFAKAGGRVLFLGRTPSRIYGKTVLDAREATPQEFAFAKVETSAQLPSTPTPPAQPPTEALKSQVVPAAIEQAVAEVVGAHTISLDAPDTALKVVKRRLADADVYLFFNEGDQPKAHSVTLHTKGIKAEAWFAANGDVTPLTSTHAKGEVTIKLDLKPYETELVVVR